ncbi:unnamed protein product [Acanthosepion pharaonis]|uniref:Uncharacterized protein n=1 Tax=Acanthosepion pharaonis TaxID=158019 RepID=A0A812BFK9_ACAPH|nr:unnamed protein product [Sepia pharaonis]
MFCLIYSSLLCCLFYSVHASFIFLCLSLFPPFGFGIGRFFFERFSSNMSSLFLVISYFLAFLCTFSIISFSFSISNNLFLTFLFLERTYNILNINFPLTFLISNVFSSFSSFATSISFTPLKKKNHFFCLIDASFINFFSLHSRLIIFSHCIQHSILLRHVMLLFSFISIHSYASLFFFVSVLMLCLILSSRFPSYYPDLAITMLNPFFFAFLFIILFWLPSCIILSFCFPLYYPVLATIMLNPFFLLSFFLY